MKVVPRGLIIISWLLRGSSVRLFIRRLSHEEGGELQAICCVIIDRG